MTKKTWNAIVKVQQNLERWSDMDKDKILAAARDDKHRGGEFENKETARSGLLSSAIALLVGVVLFLLEYFINGTVNVGLIAVGMTAAGVDSIYEGIKLKRNYMTVIGIVQLLVAIFAILIFIAKVVST